jgi:uncharacterized protein
MKWSRYNFLFESEKYGYLIYNSLTNSFAELNKTSFNTFKLIQENPDQINLYLSEEELKTLKHAKILTDNDYDEYLNIKLNRHLKRFDKESMALTIAPTLHCNFACDYCFEKSRPNVYMTDELENQTIEFIKRHTEIKKLSITWFGGEPLLSFDRIKSLTNKIKSLGITYSSSIITNGYLLTQTVVNNLFKLKIRHVHITIDGPKEIHNKRRPHIKKNNSFEQIYENIQRLKPLIKANKVSLSVRINIDHTNALYYHEIYKKLKVDFEGLDISVYAGIVKKTYGSCSSIDDQLLDNQEQASFNIEQYEKHNINNPDFFPIKVSGECMARKLYGYLIDARGDIYKCWSDVGDNNEAVGNISNMNSINSIKLTRYLTGADPFDKQECQNCFFLPVCSGGCPHLALKKQFNDNPIDLCLVAKNNLQKFLEIYYELKTKKQGTI